jgi:predicted MFS family arabinose efflux permease
MAAIGLIGSNGLILSPVLADVAAELGTGIANVGWALSSFGLGTALAALWLGRSLDDFGIARALRLALLISGIAQIAASFSQTWQSLVLAEFAVGLASGVALPAIYALAAEIAPKGAEAKTRGAVIFGWSIALIAAIPLGAAVADLIGWRLMLMVLGALSIAIFPLLRRIRGRHKVAGDAEPMGRFTPLSLPGGSRAYLICCLFMASFYGCYAYSGAYVTTGFGVSTTSAGLIALSYGIGFGVTSLMAGVIDRIGRDRVRIIGFPLAAVTLLALGLVPVYAGFLALMLIWGACNNLLVNTIISGLTGLAPKSKGATLGLYSGVTYLAASAGTFGMGWLFDHVGFVAIGSAAAALHLGILALVWLEYRQNRRAPA